MKSLGDSMATTNLIRFWFKCKTSISYHMQHSKPHSDTAVYAVLSWGGGNKWHMADGNRHLELPEAPTQPDASPGYLAHEYLFLGCYRTIQRIRVSSFPQRFYTRKGDWHCHLALFCKMSALSLLHARRFPKKLVETDLMLWPTHIAQLVYTHTYTSSNLVRALTGWDTKYWIIQRR